MSLPFSAPLAIAAYAVVWVALHFGCGYLAHRLPSSLLTPGSPLGRLLRARAWETGGRVYAQLFAIAKWKDRLPEAGGLFAGGFSKGRLTGREPAYLDRFEVETNRAELSHWLTLASGVSFFAWNPWQVGVAMIGYAALANLPFILVQRYNRPRIRALKGRRAPVVPHRS